MMRIDLYRSPATFVFLLLCGLFVTGCGGGDDATTSDAGGAPSASQQAIATEVNAQMGEQSGGGHGGGDGDGYEGGSDYESEDMYAGESRMYEGDDYEESNYEDGGSSDNMYGEQQYGGGQNNLTSRPADVMQWTDAQVLEAVAEKDTAVLQVIQAKAAASQGDPAFAQLMAQVLQTTSGENNPAATAAGGIGGGFGIPGLGRFFGGGAAPGKSSPSVPTMPNIAPGSVPPGGAFYQPDRTELIDSPLRGIDSLEIMIGEATLSFSPQAAQATRGAAERMQGSLQNTPGGHDAAGGAPGGGMATGGAPSGHDGGGNATQGGAPGGHDAGGGGYPSNYGESMESGQSTYPGANGGNQYNPGQGQGYANGTPGGGQQRPLGNLQDEELVRTVVRALVFNNSAPSWQTLSNLVNGTILTSLPRPINIQIVLTEIFSGDQKNIAAATDLLAAATKTVAAEPAENQASMRILAALSQIPASHFLMLEKHAPPPPAAPPGRGMAGGGMNANGMMGATAGIPGQPNAAMPGRGGMSEYPEGYGSSEMSEDNYEDDMGMEYGAQGYGRPPGPPPTTLPPVQISEPNMAAVASVLWSEANVAALNSQLNAAASPETILNTVAFASTIPLDSVRHSTFELFERVHSEGTGSLMSSGLFRDITRDPGMLTVLKALPRTRHRKPATPNPNAPALPPDPSESWTAATQEVVLALRDRLRDLSDDPNLAYDGQQRLRLHRDAIPERSIMIKAPSKAAEELGTAAPSATEMYYTLCRFTPMKKSDQTTVGDHYEKRSKGLKHIDPMKGILWYDGVKVNQDGTRETMDIIIEQVGFKPRQNAGYGDGGGGYEDGGAGYGDGGYGGGGTAGAQLQYTIEVIVVVTKDPKASPTDAAVSTAATN